MSQNPKANLSWVPQRAGIPTHMRKGKVLPPRNFSESSHIRIRKASVCLSPSGQVGDWEAMFSPKQRERMEKAIEERLGGDQLSGLRDILRTAA